MPVFEDFFARFAAGDHFIEQKHDVSTVQGGDGQQVHEGENDGEQCRDVPEASPVPCGAKNAAQRDEAAEFTDDPWEIWCYIIANAKEQLPPVFFGRVP